MLECVPNVSEGRRADVVERMGAGCAACLLDVHSDADHHRTVFTLAAESSDELEECVKQLTEAVVGHADDAWRDGVPDPGSGEYHESSEFFEVAARSSSR